MNRGFDNITCQPVRFFRCPRHFPTVDETAGGAALPGVFFLLGNLIAAASVKPGPGSFNNSVHLEYVICCFIAVMTVTKNYLNAMRQRLWITTIFGCALQLAVTVTAQNLAVNPGFETGDTTGWSVFSSPTITIESLQTHSGDYACLVTNRTDTYMGIAQSFFGVLQSNRTYAVSVWVQLVNGASQTMQLTAQKMDGGGTTYSSIASATVSAGGWTQLSGQYTLSVSNSLGGLLFYVEVPSSANAAYYVDDLSVRPVNGIGTNGECTVDWTNVFQRIDGFGASSAWNNSWSPAQANMFFSTNSGSGISLDGKTNFLFNGIGLSLLRNHIAYAGSTVPSATPGTVETGIMQMAQARGARVWSSPWTPPPGFKSNGGPNGGNYLGSGNNLTNLAYASQLANYVSSMKNNYGINIYALSLQNEPDAAVTTYEACVWTGTQFHDFVTNLYNALVVRGLAGTKIILPESQNWTGNSDLYTPTLNDPAAAAEVSIIANHDYVVDNVSGDTATPAAPSVSGKTVWETEVSQIGGSYDASINNAIYWAGRIHLYMTAAQANAWHYWWLIPLNPDNEGLTDTNGIPAKRMYALGQFSKFVRPNYYRINVANNTGSTLVSAYKDSVSQNFAIVAINSSSSTVTQSFNLANFTATSLTPWVTSSNLSIASQAVVNVTNSAFAYTLPPLSMVTFAGQALNTTGPNSLPIANQSVNAGVQLFATNLVADQNVPPLSLTFSLLNGPVNSTLAPLASTSAVFKWRPLVSQAGTTNSVSIVASDNGTPSLSATNTFNITVNPLTQPTIGAVSISPGQINLPINGPSGPDYTVLTSTNLASWQPLFTTNSPAMPFTLMDTNLNNAARFYRIQIGP